MNICWQYLDKRGAAIKALKDYDSMRYILAHTDEEISEEKAKSAGIRASVIDGMPKNPNPSATENRIVNSLDRIDVLRERYRQAREYMEWFRPAWEELSEDERFVLEAAYQSGDGNQSGAVYSICDRYGIERSSAYNRKNRALEHLSTLLYGK